mmetsp:Transcript_25011/g.30767  ORF Transcript_25011/g.30767 Transcript_25011/m.30767 type:complete len:416 (+) Transcript_25011:187-1434(+)
MSTISKSMLFHLRRSTISSTSISSSISSASRLLSTKSSSSSSSSLSSYIPIHTKINNHQKKQQSVYFSNEATKLSSEQEEQSEEQTKKIVSQFLRERPQSILETTASTSTSTLTPGQSWSILQKHLAGGNQIRHSDFVMLCQTSRPKYPKDAKVLVTALVDLKRCNRFIASKECAEAAMKGMYRSLLPDTNTGSDGNGDGDDAVVEAEAEYKVKAGLFLGKAFTNENTGLYVSAQTELLDELVMKPILDGLTSLIHLNDDNDEGKELKMEAQKVTQDIIHTLFKRASNPTRDMKKRAKRKYLKYKRCSGGPTQETIDYAVKIVLQCAGADADEDSENDGGVSGVKVAKRILQKYEQKSFLGTALESTYTVVKEAEEEILAATAAAAAVAEEEASATDGEEGGDSEEGEATTEKKD